MSTFDVIGARLRKAREARGISLENLAAATRINIKFLKEIDEGNHPDVPETYARAFIRAYAEYVGLNPGDLAKDMGAPDASSAPKPIPQAVPAATTAPAPGPGASSTTAPGGKPTSPGSASPPAKPPITFQYQKSSASPVPPPKPSRVFAEDAGGIAPSSEGMDRPERPAGSHVRVIMMVLLVLTIASIGAYLWIHHEQSAHPAHTTAGGEVPQREIALSAPQPVDTVREQPPQVRAADTPRVHPLTTRPQPKALAGSADSLRLEALVSESVWVQIVIDGRGPREYLLRPGSRMRWDAQKAFTVTVGNPAGIAFTLNGESLSPLGESRKPVKNVDISLETLPKLSKAAQDKRSG